jgi:hypothetical protein
LTNKWTASNPELVQINFGYSHASISGARRAAECIADSRAYRIRGIAKKIWKSTPASQPNLIAISDAPGPLRGALVESFPLKTSVRLLVHAPAFSIAGEKTPATVLAVTSDGWLVASETEDGGASVENQTLAKRYFLN